MSAATTYRTLADVLEIATGKVTIAHLHCVEDSLRRVPSLVPDFAVTQRDDESMEPCGCAGCPASPYRGW